MRKVIESFYKKKINNLGIQLVNLKTWFKRRKKKTMKNKMKMMLKIFNELIIFYKIKKNHWLLM